MWQDLHDILNSLLGWSNQLWQFMIDTPLVSVVIALFVLRLVFDIFVYIKKKFTL